MYHIRKATVADVSVILDIYNDGNSVFGWLAQDIKSTFEEQVQNGIVFIMEDNEHQIAFISMQPVLKEGTHIFMSALYVLKGRQRSGIGSKLLEYAEKEISKAGKSKKIVLKALKPCLWVETFYKKNGYTALDSKTGDTILDRYFPAKSFETVMFKNV